MKSKVGCWLLLFVIVLIVSWHVIKNSADIQRKVNDSLGFDLGIIRLRTEFQTTSSSPKKCDLTKECPHTHFAIRIMSGAADVVGPKICFNGKIIMSHVLNNVGPGLNVVVVDGESGVVEKFGYLDMINGKPEEVLAYLKEIKPGMIVLVASFNDVAAKMTDEIKEVFAGMGSTSISSVNQRDNWVFAGRVGASNKSLFEKLAVNNEQTNVLEGWPGSVEVGGCFPRTQTA